MNLLKASMVVLDPGDLNGCHPLIPYSIGTIQFAGLNVPYNGMYEFIV